MIITPFELKNVKYIRVAPKDLMGAYSEQAFGIDGEIFKECINQSINKLEMVKEPDITVYMNDNKEVRIGYGFYIRFIDGDNFTDYFLLDISDEMENAYIQMLVKAKIDIKELMETLEKPTITAYQLRDIRAAYIAACIDDNTEEMIFYELTIEDISAVTTAFNEAFETIMDYEYNDNGWSFDPPLTIEVSKTERVDIYTTPETDKLLVSYVKTLPEENRIFITNYSLKSSKLFEVFVEIKKEAFKFLSFEFKKE